MTPPPLTDKHTPPAPQIIAAVIFDLDGVLIDSEVLACRAISDFLAEQDMDYSPETVERRFAGYTDEDLAAIVAEEQGRSLPADFPARVAERALALFETKLNPVPGGRAVLRQLTCKKAVASNSLKHRILRSLEIAGLADCFATSAVFSSEEVAAPKPAPDVYRHAAASLQVAPAQCLVIEDSPTGVRAGVAAGMTVVGFLGGSHRDEAAGAALRELGAWQTVTGFDELAQLLRGLEIAAD